MTMMQLATVDFQGQALLTMKDAAGVVRVAVRPVIEAMGLDWSGQRQRIMRDPVLAEGVVIMTTPSGGGLQETLTLPLDMLNGFLFGINASKVKPELRELVIAYQRECYRALADYWAGTATAARSLTERDRQALRAEAAKWTSRLRQTSNREERRLLHTMLAEVCAKLGIVVPQLDGLGSDEPEQADIVDAFWQGVALVEAAGMLRNHSIPKAALALKMTDVQEAFDQMKIKIRINANLRAALRTSNRPRFLAYKNVRSRITGTAMHCMVFEATGLPAPAVPTEMLI
ncbi:MAG: hypothetical protein KGR68_09805 [Betaproteobacteria bacterium]|nr:hypothetical protein [Betaproteobacteria bacterium]